MNELVTYRILKKDTETGEEFTGLDEVAFTSDPAIITKGFAFKGAKKLSFKDEPKMRIVAPAMIPMEIYRNQDGEEFNVSFSEEQIDLIHAELMLKISNGESLFNFEHDKEKKVPAYVLEAWIVDNPKEDKAYTTYGIEVPKGTLMLTTQITDKDYYNKLVENDQLGYSIGGSFGLKLSKQLNTNTMGLPEGVQLSEGKQYVFSNGQLVEVEVKLSEETTEEVEEVKEEETEMATDEKTEDTTEEVTEEKETETEMAEEPATSEALTEEKVAQMIDAKVSEVLNMLAEIKAGIEEKKEETMEEEEQAPVQLSAFQRLAQFSKSNKK
jgi:hypothetical protein